MTLKERFHLFTPFTQVLFLVLVGAVAFFIINILIAVIFQSAFPSVDFDNYSNLIENHPILYMLMGFLPFQLGFLLIPGVLYFFYLKSNKTIIHSGSYIDWIWSILLFASVFFLLPFFSEINHIIAKSLGVYEYLLKLKESTDEVMFSLLYASDTSTYIAGILLIALLAGVAEELIFRGFLFHHILKHTKSIYLSIIASAFVFAILHFNYFQLLPLLVFGMALAMIYYISGSLIPGIILHAANNALNVYWIKVDGFPFWMDNIYLEITIPSTLLLMGLIYFKRLRFKKP
jgi:membrane protease YdiL (CAAX protease family)